MIHMTEQHLICFSYCMFKKEDEENVCGSKVLNKICKQRAPTPEDAKPTIHWEDTMLSTYAHILERAYKDHEALTDLNRLQKGKYEDHIFRCQTRIDHYEKLSGDMWNEIEATHIILKGKKPGETK